MGTKVILRVSTIDHAAGDEVDVDSKTAEFLVANGHGVKASDAPAEVKPVKK